MKLLSRIALTTGCALIMGFSSPSGACDEHMTGSRKTQTSFERDGCTCSETTVTSVGYPMDMTFGYPHVTTIGYTAVTPYGLAASPKTQWLLEQNRVVAVFPTLYVERAEIRTTTVGYQSTGTDSIAASPKAREQMRATTPEVTVFTPAD